MKQFIFLSSIVLIFLNNSIYAQNLLLESDFQLETYVGLCPLLPSLDAQIDNNYNHWESRYANEAKYRRNKWQVYKYRDCRYKYYGNENGDDYESCKCCDYHSPDIYTETINNYKNYYIRLGEVELIQQKLIDQNELEEGKFYKVKLKIRIPTYLGVGTDYNFLDEDLKLKIMFAKNKIKYKKPGSRYGRDPIEDMCNVYGKGDYHNGYYEYKANGIKVLKEIYVNDYVKDIWTEVAFVFQAPNEWLNKYNWFAIDVEGNKNGNSKNFIDIDDITLEETEQCNTENDCSPTDGIISPSKPSKIYHDYKNYAVLNLDNVYSATNIKIKYVSGQEVAVIPDVYCENGIGKVEWTGDHIYEGVFFWEMTLTNDCGADNYIEKFEFRNPNNNPSKPILNNCNTSVGMSAPCCEAEPNILINNETIQGAGRVYYHALNNISISNTIIKSSATNVTFKAGNEIVLNTGFETEQGANVDMIIEACENKKIEKKDSLYEKEVFNDIYVDDIEISNEETINNNNIEQNNLLFQIHPNPAKDYFNIHINSVNNSCGCNNFNIITITNLSGKKYYKQKLHKKDVMINISNFPAGIYFVNIKGKEFSETKKLIVQ